MIIEKENDNDKLSVLSFEEKLMNNLIKVWSFEKRKIISWKGIMINSEYDNLKKKLWWSI